MKKLVRDNMSTDLVTIGCNERMEAAFRRMRTQGVRHLPVHNDAGEIVGMLSDRDVQRSMISTIEKDEFTGLKAESVDFDPNSRVRDYMNWPVKCVDQHASLKEVASIMVEDKVSSLLVAHGERIVGIITAEDLLKVLIDLLSDPKTPARWDVQKLLEKPFHQLESTLL